MHSDYTNFQIDSAGILAKIKVDRQVMDMESGHAALLLVKILTDFFIKKKESCFPMDSCFLWSSKHLESLFSAWCIVHWTTSPKWSAVPPTTLSPKTEPQFGLLSCNSQRHHWVVGVLLVTKWESQGARFASSIRRLLASGVRFLSLFFFFLQLLLPPLLQCYSSLHNTPPNKTCPV